MKILGGVASVCFGILIACGQWTPSSSSQTQAVSFPDTQEGRANRQGLIDRASVDGSSSPQSISQLVAGPETLKICQTNLGEKVTCQPKYLGNESSGRPIISFPELHCDFIRPGDPDYKILSGKTEKFYCLAKDENGKSHRVKVKYKSRETYTEVAATRLLWTFGFAVDTVQPLSVTCMGCPEDPFPMLMDPNKVVNWPARDTETRFIFAALEQKFPGDKVNIEDENGVEVLEGFTYPELLKDLPRNPHLNETQKDRREALAFLNAFLYNLDAKSENQRLGCIKETADSCEQAVAIAQDVGFTFGSSPTRGQKLDLNGWRELPVWQHTSRCDASHHLRLGGVDIGVSIGLSETGRQEVEKLFTKVNSEWLRNLFETARFGAAGFVFPNASAEWSKASANQNVLKWVEAFEHRVAQFRNVTQCPAERR